MTKIKKKKWKIILPIAVVVVVILMIVGAGSGNENTALEVETAKAKKEDIKAILETSGTIGSEDIRSYSSPVTAEVKDMNIKVGDIVKKGDYLITYNTASLEKSYTISELQSKAENAMNEKSLEMSAKGSAQAVEASTTMQALQGQIDGLSNQVTGLSGQVAASEEAAQKAEALEKEMKTADARIEELSKKESLTAEEETELGKLQKEKEKNEETLAGYQETVKSADEAKKQLEAAQKQMESLQGSMAEAQAKKEAGEAAVLTEAEKQGIQSSSQAARLTLSQSAEALSSARAGIVAEYDGIVISTEVAAGGMAQEGMSMFSIADSSKMCIDFQLSKYNLQNVKEGQKAEITSLGNTYKGSVISIGKVAEKTEAGAAMAKARVRIDNPDTELIIGLDAELKIELGNKKDVLSVPIAAVNTDTKGDFVYILKKGKVEKKYITTGIASQKQIEITDGLKEGESVITTIDSAIEEGVEAVEKKNTEK